MDYQLDSKTAFVTGSTAGIGFSIARMLAAEGCKVIINGRTQERVDQAVSEISADVPGVEITGVAADFSVQEDIDKLVPMLSEVDILVNNVGIFTSQKFQDTPDSDWQRMFDVNIMSGVRLSRIVLPHLLNRNWGRIVFISSECAELVPADLVAYSATKAALHAVSKGIAQSTRGTGVTVNTVMPGSTLSEGARRFLDDKAKEEGRTPQEVESDFFTTERASSLLQRFATTDEVAHAVTYLCSPISSATNGAVVKVEGGAT